MEFTIKLDEQEAKLVLQALGELPIKIAVNTFLKVNSQLSLQQDTTGTTL